MNIKKINAWEVIRFACEKKKKKMIWKKKKKK